MDEQLFVEVGDVYLVVLVVCFVVDQVGVGKKGQLVGWQVFFGEWLVLVEDVGQVLGYVVFWVGVDVFMGSWGDGDEMVVLVL